MSKKNNGKKKTRIFTPILWCIVTVMWIITIIVDLIYSIPGWLIIVHGAFGLFSLIVAIVYFAIYAHANKVKREQYV